MHTARHHQIRVAAAGIISLKAASAYMGATPSFSRRRSATWILNYSRATLMSTEPNGVANDSL